MKFCMELLNIVLKERTLPPVVNSIMSTHHSLLARDLNQNAPDNHRNSSNGPNIICLMLIKRLSSVMPWRSHILQSEMLLLLSLF